MARPMGDELFELASVQAQPQHVQLPEATCKAVFDNREELLWTGSETGWIYAFLSPLMKKYSAFRAHTQHVSSLLPSVDGVLSLSRDTLRLNSRGGLVHMTHSDSAKKDMVCMDWERPGGLRVAIGHESAMVTVFDLLSGRITTQVRSVLSSSHCPVSQGVAVLRGAGRFVAVGGNHGEVTLRDPRTLRAEFTLDAHSGAVNAIDFKGDLLCTSGLSQRLGQVYCDPLVKVFDVRATARALTHIHHAPGPMMLRFQPKFTSMLLVASSTGAFSLYDVQSGGVPLQSYQVDTEGDSLLDCDISATGESFAFADSGGYVHLWASSETPRVNIFSVPTEVPEPVNPRSMVYIDEDGPYSAIPLPATDESLLSSYDPTALYRVGLPPRFVDPELLKQMKQVDFVGYLQNPAYRRGKPYGDATRAVHSLRTARVNSTVDQAQRAAAEEQRRAILAGIGFLGPDQKRRHSSHGLPKMYRKMTITQSKLKFEEFDFSNYNHTRFAGLENDLPNCYCNALLQVLYFIPPLRAAVTSHVCDKDFCLTCELGFMLHMLSLAKSAACQASNLLRSLRQIREAAALGLLEGSDELGTTKEKSLAKRIQTFSRFMLEQLHKEFIAASISTPSSPQRRTPGAQPSNGSVVDQLFGASVHTRTKCLSGAHDDITRDTRTFQFDLQFPTIKPGAERPSSTALLARSLHRQEENMRAWCDKCQAYKTVSQTRILASLPPILAFHCTFRDVADMLQWQSDPSQPRTPTASPTARGRTDSTTADADAQQQHLSWLPMSVHIELDQARSSVKVAEVPASSPALTAENPAVGRRYELMAVVALVREPGETMAVVDGDHLVAHIKVPQSYVADAGGISRPGRQDARTAKDGEVMSPVAENGMAAAAVPTSPVDSNAQGFLNDGNNWVLFNDFFVTQTRAQEVLQLYGTAKVPCLLFYISNDVLTQRPTMQGVPSAPQGDATQATFTSPISEDLFRQLTHEPSPARSPRPRPQKTPTFIPLDLRTERPHPGMLMGIDAEFVALAPPEMETREGGVEVVARPSRLGLGRVSVVRWVRGEGARVGICCIDDYVKNVEPVYDYLTRFSGLSHGDLDPSMSTHHITTLKRAYLKLRYLVDNGCRQVTDTYTNQFVGHGLKTDFRMINIVVPPEQIIDTVELFHLKRQRKLSLRFLSSYLLRTDIQKDTHDSIEDARTALKLYEKYRELTAAGKFNEILLETYRYGRLHNWEVSASQPPD
eukprot:jgi/Chlat1/3473/Chrsp23S03668